jgi:predicted phosphodiesterase
MSSKAQSSGQSEQAHAAAGTSQGPIAVLSDIHSNLHALEAVFTECALRDICRFFCLGDIVGYGAFPSECLHAIRSLKCPTILGNHDESVAQGKPAYELNYMARAGIEYSVQCLGKTGRDWLSELTPVIVDGAATLVHASLAEPLEWDYVTTEQEAKRSFARQETPICFYGHTHLPKLYSLRGRPGAKPCGEHKAKLDPTGQYLINPGSVGQPRGGDPRAQFVVFDPSELTIEFVCIEYDVGAASQAIISAGLPKMLAERLYLGL